MEYLLEEAQQGGLTANESVQVKKILETVTGTSTNTDSVLASVANKTAARARAHSSTWTVLLVLA